MLLDLFCNRLQRTKIGEIHLPAISFDHRPVFGGLLLGIIETFAKAYISTDLSDAIVFLALIVVLLVRPTGLLGKYVPEKV